MKYHWHYKITGYNSEDKKKKVLRDIVQINVMANDEEEALNKAKTCIKKGFYRIAEAFECLEEHGLQNEIQMTSLEIQKKSLDALMGKK